MMSFLRDICSICRCCLNVATSKWKVHNGKIENISFRGVGQGMKQAYLYLWYPLFQVQCDRCDQQNYSVKGHIDSEWRLRTEFYDTEMISIFPLWTFHLDVATFQQHIYISSIYLSDDTIYQSLWLLSGCPWRSMW
jgi:hypothetical protein